MAQIRTVDATAKRRLKKRSKTDQERDQYRLAIAQLGQQGMIEVEPEDGETLRKIKLNLSRAAKDGGVTIKYGETHDNTILVWLADPPTRRRGRRPKAAAEATA